MTKEILGVGWKYPVMTDGQKRIAISRYGEDVEEAIRIILGTAKGERLMRPEFGCGIHDLVYASINHATIAQVELAVREALTVWEPRIEVMKVSTDTQAAADGKLLVSIDYRLRATNTMANLVYPFYLKEGGG